MTRTCPSWWLCLLSPGLCRTSNTPFRTSPQRNPVRSHKKPETKNVISPSDIFVDLFSSPVLSFIPPLLCSPAVAEQPSQEEQPSPGHLSPVALSNLSPQHCAVFLFGCQVVRLLSSSPTFPPVLLLLARSLPASSHDGVQLAHCAGDYYYDSSHQVLYLSEITLQDVGQFISTILQAMAYLSSGKSLDNLSLRSFTLQRH